MIFQCIRTMEALITGSTAIASFIAMNQSMLIVNGSSQECLVAISTFVRTLTSMTFTNVVIQIRANGELAIASIFGAFKRFYA